MKFVVDYRGPDGSRQQKEIEAADRKAAFAELSRMGINAISVREGALSNKPRKAAAGPSKPLPPSLLRGVFAGVVVVVLAVVLYLVLGNRDDKPQEEKPERLVARVNDEKSVSVPNAAEEPVKKTEVKATQTQDSDTNIVWVGKMRYIKKMANGASVMVFVDNPDDPKPVPIFEVGLNNFLTNFTTPGEDVPETPMEVSDEEVVQALTEKIEIKEEDSEEVRFQKEGVMVLREELSKFIKDGGTVADFIRDIQRRQQMEAEYVREARNMIMDSLAEDDPAQARKFYDAVNKHMNEKGLPNIRLPRKFLKMMEETE